MMRISIISIFLFGSLILRGQSSEVSPLFADQSTLNIRLKISLKEVKKETNDSTYMDGLLFFEKEKNIWDSISVRIRTRGDFRLKNCFFSPLRLKIKKSDAKGTLFEGNRALKLVLPCRKSKDNNELIIREYMCYKMYELITPYTFSTRRLNIDFVDQSGKNDTRYQLAGFFIEDDDEVAERHHAEVMENLNLHPLALHDTTAIRHDMFQYLIANIDWSTTFQHNAKIIHTEKPFRNIPLTYDFDQSGFVNASYATLNPEFNMASVTDRVYRGFCRSDNEVVNYVREQFIQQEQPIFEILKAYQSDMEARAHAAMVKFVEDFYKTIKSDKLFNEEILNKCRKE